MQVYLPIAEISVDVLLILGLGFGVGFLSGLFGVGGGFLMTPLLIFLGVPSPVAVATSANQTMGASVSGLIGHFRRGNVDLKMGAVLLVGGLAGSTLGVQLFAWLRREGQIDLVISLFYVVVLGVLGVLMVAESLRTILRRKRQVRDKLHEHYWAHGLPFKMRFRQSRLYISVIPPLLIGFGVGVLSAIMGVGGGFILVPAMIYLLGMPTGVTIGTSLFQLALLLMAGAVAGAQWGVRMSTKLKGEETRGLLGLMVLGVAIQLGWGLLRTPDAMFTIGPAL
jgi:uncharacterized membrane protein YfcA